MSKFTGIVPSVPFVLKRPRMKVGESYKQFRAREVRAIREYQDYRVMWSCEHMVGPRKRQFLQAFWGLEVRWIDL